ncbi:vacuolar-sorting protein Snf8p [Monosporozyma unispora]|nr:hypothetical protein C6P44_000316 [Kazachstania unispora]
MKKFGVAAFEDDERVYNETLKQFDKQTEQLTEQLGIFQEKLVEFANRHNEEIKSNPEFRSKFLHMCNTIGIDPLNLYVGRDKHLFTVNDFIYELSIKIIQICRNTKDLNGGLISFDELLNTYFKTLNITEGDLVEAIDLVSTLDGGFEILKIKGTKILRSVPNELTNDQTKILEVCSIMGYASVSLLRVNLKWSKVRCKSVLDEMVTSGILWIDSQTHQKEMLFWDPAWIAKSLSN